jgi:LysM repeat protein
MVQGNIVHSLESLLFENYKRRKTIMRISKGSLSLEQPISQQSDLYTAQRGDTLSSIAAKLGVSESDLASSNNLAPGTHLKPGQPLNIPQVKQKSPIQQGITSVRDTFEPAKGASPMDPLVKRIIVQSEGGDPSLEASKLPRM